MVILEPTINAAYSTQFGLSQDNTAVTIECIGLQVGETATLQIFDEISQTFVNALINGIVPTADNNNNRLTIWNEWGAFRVSKSPTANPVGVSMISLNSLNT